VNADLTYAGGCPEEFSEYVKYAEGDEVEVNGVVFQCMGWPYSTYCNVAGFEPFGDKSDLAWAKLGYW